MFAPFAIHYFALALFAGLLVLAAVHDVRAFRIPNHVCLAIALLYPVHVLTAPTAVDWLWAVAIAAGFFAIGIVLFATRVMGGGDVKLIAATGLWAGPGMAIDFLVVMALTGGVMAVVLSSRLRFGVAWALETLGHTGARDAILKSNLPYGVAIAGGGLYVAVVLLGAAAGQ